MCTRTLPRDRTTQHCSSINDNLLYLIMLNMQFLMPGNYYMYHRSLQLTGLTLTLIKITPHLYSYKLCSMSPVDVSGLPNWTDLSIAVVVFASLTMVLGLVLIVVAVIILGFKTQCKKVRDCLVEGTGEEASIILILAYIIP